MRYDTTLKQLFQTLPQRLLQLLVGQEATELVPVEFPSVKKRVPDLVVRLRDDSILHIELQSDSERWMDWRMLEYYGLIRQRYPDSRLIQIVLYVGSKRPNFSTIIEEPALSFRYGFKDIRDIDCREMMASPCLEENMLSILCSMENVRETIHEIMSRIVGLPTKERTDAIKKLVILAGLRKLETIIEEEVNEMAISIDVMENSFLRNLYMKAEQRGEERGEKRGEQRGEERGERNATEKMFVRLLVRRFGNISSEVYKKVSMADKDTLERWSERVMDENSIDNLLNT